jgi:hypothetical protein
VHRVAADEQTGRHVRAVVRGGANGERDIEGEQPLRAVVGLARPGADEVAQRPLREQQQDQRQHQPGTEPGGAIERWREHAGRSAQSVAFGHRP